MQRYSLLLLASLLAGPVAAQHEHGGTTPAAATAHPWTRMPLLLPAGGRGERAAAQVKAVGIAAEALSVHAPGGPPDARQRNFPLTAEGAKIASAAPSVGNYHWLVAREASPELVKVASSVWYFGNPGPSPRALLGEPKHELEIVPDPLPREHGSYRESEKWRFVVRLHGQPLAKQPLTLETEFGTRTTFFTDSAGVATVLFPRDFRPPPADAEGGRGGHGRPSAKFVLSTETDQGGQRFLTAFNLTYGPDPERGRSLAWGAAFCLAGMVAATPLLRRRPGQPGKESRDA
ncbi:hypothetical protein [Dechloromonas sp. A34]|uniref:hypothetical protein n=1 Tax=Dechloromonas sp. A34 TaxID=447588 RepID=UPI0022487BFF|nr:hypothetical protein [Dechloromonas sp. A34]